MYIEHNGTVSLLRKGRRERGTTLLELIAFIAIVGVALAGVLSVLNVTAGHSADPMVRKQMLSIAESLLEEVTLQSFTYCDPTDANASTATSTAGCATLVQGFGQPAVAGANRSLYNNVGNYCSEVGTGQEDCTALSLGTAGSAASFIPDLTGTGANSSPPGYWATIELVPEELDGITSGTAAADMNVLRIKVTVACVLTSETVVLEGYRTRWAVPHI